MIWTFIAFTLIILAWFVQLVSMWDKNKDINHWFVFFYSLGVLALVIDAFYLKNPDIAILNIITFIFSAVVLIMIFTNKSKTIVKPIKRKKK